MQYLTNTTEVISLGSKLLYSGYNLLFISSNNKTITIVALCTLIFLTLLSAIGFYYTNQDYYKNFLFGSFLLILLAIILYPIVLILYEKHYAELSIEKLQKAFNNSLDDNGNKSLYSLIAIARDPQLICQYLDVQISIYGKINIIPLDIYEMIIEFITGTNIDYNHNETIILPNNTVEVQNTILDPSFEIVKLQYVKTVIPILMKYFKDRNLIVWNSY